MRTLARTTAILLFLGVLLVSSVPSAGAAPDDVGLQSLALTNSLDTATVAGTGGAGLRLRGGAGLGYGVLLVMPEGAAVEVRGQARSGDGYSWYPVAYAGRSGWAAGSYLDFAGPAAPAPAAPVAAAAPAPVASGNGIVGIIVDAANRYGQSPDAMLAVARCESTLNPNAYNASSGASGLFQFLPSTWRTTPYAAQSIWDPWASANAAAWMWSVGRRGEWVC